jgi:HD-like signal output (HDOD) protein
MDQLPALPTIVTRLIEVINSPDSSADDAAELIEQDPALTGKMIRLANSAFYGMPRSISSVNSAVVVLGFNTIRSLVLSASLMKMFPPTTAAGCFDGRRFWLHSITTALGAKAIIRQLMQVKMMDPESAFCAGILHDIGKLVFMHLMPTEYAGVCTQAVAKKMPLIAAEKEFLGVDHAELGSIIADKWALPLDLENSLVFHHSPQGAGRATDLLSAVHLADALAHEQGHATLVDETPAPCWEQATEVLGLTAAMLAHLRTTIGAESQKAKEFFAIVADGR